MLNWMIAAAGLAMPAMSAAAAADAPGLAQYFGFDPMRVIVVDRDAGPVIVADFNNDGRPDIAVVNNGKSRIELFLLRDKEKTAAEMEQNLKVNAIPSNPMYDRREISLSQRVTALRSFGVDGDGKLDLIYVGASPAELVVMKQEGDLNFKVASRQRVRGLAARQSGLRIADVVGDSAPEVVTLAEDKIQIFPLGKDAKLGEPRRISVDKPIAGMIIDDYNGDGLTDILGVAADEQMPLRMWLQRQDPRVSEKRGLLGAEVRFESPALRDVDQVTFPGHKAASIGVIERLSRRVVLYDLVSEPIDLSGTATEREVQAEAYGFADGASKDRAVSLLDVDGDGLVDLVATDAKNNTIVLYRQSQGIGLGDAEPFSAFKQPKAIAAAPAGAWDGTPTAKVFVLSEEEKSVGVARYNAQTKKLDFPEAVAIKTPGATPAAIGYVNLDGVGTLAVVVKAKRDHTLELNEPSQKDEKGEPLVVTVPLTGVTRPPQSMLACDADQDGLSDLLLFTPGEPMIMVRGTPANGAVGGPGKPSEVLTNEKMPSFGLVQAAGPGNTGLLDVDGDGKPELLIADKNYVRACRYDAKTGWRVVSQVTVSDPGTDLVGLTILDDNGKKTLLAADKANARLVFIDGDKVTRRLRLSGFTPTSLYAGAFGGDNQPGVLGLDDDAFALTRLAGSRLKLESFTAYRSDSKDRAEHDVEFGDVNGDGFMDAVVLDGAEQMCSILTFSAKRAVQLATEFEVFESRLFSGGESREFEPRDCILTDCTGDGKTDVLLLVHDRVIIYPQARKK